ncbi:MAG: hypothetical protein H7A25_18590 [Leptospiraceae bacterium]|nr:hypothetical protein [Leptospiraceae bacterium]MCP5501916.1 hypothetical protein [Leptospiraceae bacterium]
MSLKIIMQTGSRSQVVKILFTSLLLFHAFPAFAEICHEGKLALCPDPVNGTPVLCCKSKSSVELLIPVPEQKRNKIQAPDVPFISMFEFAVLLFIVIATCTVVYLHYENKPEIVNEYYILSKHPQTFPVYGYRVNSHQDKSVQEKDITPRTLLIEEKETIKETEG